MQSIAGATHVKWSKINEYLLATGHEMEVRIWDKRKCNSPIHYIAAHLSKINDIDWNPVVESQFVSCSQDGNIKVSILFFLIRSLTNFSLYLVLGLDNDAKQTRSNEA